MKPEEPPLRGKAIGGAARAKSLSATRRKAIAVQAAKARWDDSVPEATHIGELPIGSAIIACAVLPGGTRVLSQGGMSSAFGPVTGGWQQRKKASNEDSGALPSFLVAASLKDHISDELRTLVSKPIRYKDPRGGPIRVGIEASLLPMVCDVWLRARDSGDLTKIQEPVAVRADMLMRGLAHTGIISLVDEVTGYQKDRAADALAKILEAFIAKELQPWVHTFPRDFYEHMFRLRGLDYRSDSPKRPQYFGMLTNDIVYDRIAHGVLNELKKGIERYESGRPKHKYFQKLTSNIGYPKLREHLGAVVATMKLSDTWGDFIAKLDRIAPRIGDTLPLDYGDKIEPKDKGQGF